MALLEESFQQRAPVSALFGRRVTLPLGFAVLVIIAWQVLCERMRIPPILLPPPSAVWRVLRSNYAILLGEAMPTAAESVLSFVIASVLGVALAVCLTFSVWVREALYPNIVMFQLIPKIALAPLFIVWLGVGGKSCIVVAIFIVVERCVDIMTSESEGTAVHGSAATPRGRRRRARSPPGCRLAARSRRARAQSRCDRRPGVTPLPRTT